MLQTQFNGGTRSVRRIHASLAWPSTTLQFQVCSSQTQICLHINNFLLATSVDVERLFSRGQLILSHTRSHLSIASTRALLCLGSWSLMGLVKDEDVEAVARLDEIDTWVELNKLAEVAKG
jgi:hypothetical protein